MVKEVYFFTEMGDTTYLQEEAPATSQSVCGTPETGITKLPHSMDLVDPAYLILWGREGPMSHEVARRGMDLRGQEVSPALKAYQPDREKSRVPGGPARREPGQTWRSSPVSRMLWSNGIGSAGRQRPCIVEGARGGVRERVPERSERLQAAFGEHVLPVKSDVSRLEDNNRMAASLR